MLRILLTNDDGYRDAGIIAVYNTLVKKGHDVTIVAPELNCSGASQSIAVYCPISIHQESENIYYVTSTPTDSVRLGLQIAYEPDYPDLVISGINLGENISEDILYSGTVGAAREAALHGIPSLAVSTDGIYFDNLDAATYIIVDFVERLEKNRELLANAFLWNMNIPNKPLSELGKYEVTKLGTRGQHQQLEKQVTSRGKVIYWQGKSGDAPAFEMGTDVAVLVAGKNISITPLDILSTNYSQMSTIDALII